jgi:uncharacterized protein GlcG (DUF336 family)
MRLRDILLGRTRRGRADAPLTVQPQLEQLEDRTVPDAANLAYVNKVFPALFNRAPDAATANQLSAVLAPGNLSKPNFVLALEQTAEFRNDQVAALVQLLLNRPADAATVARYSPILAQGGTLEDVATAIATSDEYFNVVSGGSVDAFLNNLYLDALNRPIDGPSLDLLRPLAVTTAGRQQIAGAVFHSPEHFQVQVQSFYLNFLGRPGDAPGVNLLVSALTAGKVRDEQVIAVLLSSDEFVNPAGGGELTAAEVNQLLDRAVVASASNDGIIAILDRGGRILGVRVEDGVAPEILNNPEKLTFAIDGAIAKARTGAFFGNSQAPLTSRTIQEISQTTMTQREIESDPNVLDPQLRGPGFVAPIGIKGHFPADIPQTPQVDLFAIEHTNRDSINNPGPNGIRQVGADGLPAPGSDDIRLSGRFNIDPAFVPAGKALTPPESYGFTTGLFPSGQGRGIGTLPGGIPIIRNGFTSPQVVGGIGVFFPGKTGFASEENSSLNVNFDPTKPDRSLEAEYIAFAALGGSPNVNASIGTLAGIVALPQFALLSARIDLVGITLELFGPGGTQGASTLVALGRTLGTGDPTRLGIREPVDQAGNTALDGQPIASGYLVLPHDSPDGTIKAEDVARIIQQGVTQADSTRAAIRVGLAPNGNGGLMGESEATTKMVFAVADRAGNVLGLFRMADSTIFSIDVAVAKARNVAYYADPAQLQAIDQIPGVPAGTAFSNRTFRFASLPHFPEGIDQAPPGPFSILNDGGVNPLTGLQVGPRLPASAFQSIQGFDAFNPQRNFHDPNNLANQNGIVFFPGSTPLYRSVSGAGTLIGGFGVSGDGVDQDDVVTFAGAVGFNVPGNVIRADMVTPGGIRLPFQKMNRKPEAG